MATNELMTCFSFLSVLGKYDRMATSTEYTESLSIVSGVTQRKCIAETIRSYINVKRIAKVNRYIFQIYTRTPIPNKQKQRAEFFWINIFIRFHIKYFNFRLARHSKLSISKARIEAR